jgi:hypothetical protein
MAVLSTILAILLLIAVYIIYILFKKVEIHEETILSKSDDVLFLQYQFSTLLDKMHEIDNKKLFETDDEVGETFNMLKTLVEDADVIVNKMRQEENGSRDSR